MRAGTPRPLGVRRPALVTALCLAAPFVLRTDPTSHASVRQEPYCSPQEVAFSPDGAWLAVSDPTGARVWLLDTDSRETRAVSLAGAPEGLAWTAGGELLVAESGAGSVARVDPASGALRGRVAVGRYPRGLAVADGRLLVTNWATATLSVVELGDGVEQERVPLVREPQVVALSPAAPLAVVSNLLPDGRADAPDHAAVVSLVDLRAPYARRDVRLPPGSSSARGVAVGPDGRWAYVVHLVGRVHVPTTQLEQGWVSTNALSIVDLAAGELFATLLLDHPLEGAADPWGVALAPDGKTLWVTLAGVHQLARVDLARLHAYLAGGLPDDHPLARTGAYSPGTESIWVRIESDPGQRAELVNDLAALHAADLIERTPLEAVGPRGIALAPDGRTLAVASHFTGEVLLLAAEDGALVARVPLGPSGEGDPARDGERLFHDATLCFQHWLSCATCHPGEARVDGLNWDNLNDGIGNPKNLKSLLYAPETPPLMWTGARRDLPTALDKGLRFLMHRPEEGEVEALAAYLRSLEALPSPYLGPDGALTAAAERGRALFESWEVGCAECHPAPLFTDKEDHDVGTRGALDRRARFDTPSLVELFRTGPYLHDGSAASLLEVLTTRNPDDRHGITSDLDAGQLADLLAYLRSL